MWCLSASVHWSQSRQQRVITTGRAGLRNAPKTGPYPREVSVVVVDVIVDVDVIAHVRRPTKKTSTSTTTSTSTGMNAGNGRAFSIHTARGQRRWLTARIGRAHLNGAGSQDPNSAKYFFSEGRLAERSPSQALVS